MNRILRRVGSSWRTLSSLILSGAVKSRTIVNIPSVFFSRSALVVAIMRFEFILCVSIVNCGFKCVHSYRTEDKVAIDKPPDEGRIREKFQNLFDSIAKNDQRRTEVFRETLQEEALQGQQAYDAVHHEIQYSRKKNSHKKNDPHEMSEHTAFKRAARERTTAKYGCDVGYGAKLPPGKHSLDVDTCIVWYCNHNEEMEDHKCKDLVKYERQFPVFWQDCLQNDCFGDKFMG